jgi:hypothetical protein
VNVQYIDSSDPEPINYLSRYQDTWRFTIDYLRMSYTNPEDGTCKVSRHLGKLLKLYTENFKNWSHTELLKFKMIKWIKKVKLFEGVWGSGCIDPYFLDLRTSWRWVVSFTPLPLYPQGKSSRYPLDRRLDGPQSRPELRGKEKILDPTVTQTPASRLSSP